jgi:cysteine synthase A
MENENPTGSIKDRMAVATIEAAEAHGRFRSKFCVGEYTADSTGVPLSPVCAGHINSADRGECPGMA